MGWGRVVQPRFRSMWERYCRGVQAVVYVVDSTDHEALDMARRCAWPQRKFAAQQTILSTGTL